MKLRWLLLVVVAGVVGGYLYQFGAPYWLVYVVRHLLYSLGSGSAAG